MIAMDSKSGVLPVDSSLINPEFIRRLQEQRVLHKREVAFHLAKAEKHGAADEALVSMIQAAEKIIAIMFSAPTKAADAPDEATTEDVSGNPSWREATMAVVGKAAGPTYDELPTTHGLENLMSDDRTGKSGNAWRTRLLGSRT
jgi:hypothetical protein